MLDTFFFSTVRENTVLAADSKQQLIERVKTRGCVEIVSTTAAVVTTKKVKTVNNVDSITKRTCPNADSI
ncbi:hypothetical protein COOONC_08126 [Cooperia oncophora]